MAFYTLNTASPANDTFTLAASTTIQTSILGGARPEAGSYVLLEINENGTWRDYGITLSDNKPQRWVLDTAGQYRPKLQNGSNTGNDVIVSISVAKD